MMSFHHPPDPNHSGKYRLDAQEEKLELQPEFERKLAGRIKTAGKTGELNFMMEGLRYFPMGVFDEDVRTGRGFHGEVTAFSRGSEAVGKGFQKGCVRGVDSQGEGTFLWLWRLLCDAPNTGPLCPSS